MSSLWTPSGEHEVPRPQNSPAGGGPAAPPEPEAEAEPERQLTPEEEARLADAAQEMAAIRAQVAATPPEQVVANHAIGLYELAAIHLGQAKPNLAAARLAIDALSGLLASTSGRLGELEATLTAARSQIQLAFVSVAQQHSEG